MCIRDRLDTGTGVTPAGHNNGTGWIAIGTDAEASTHTTTNGAATAAVSYTHLLTFERLFLS